MAKDPVTIALFGESQTHTPPMFVCVDTESDAETHALCDFWRSNSDLWPRGPERDAFVNALLRGEEVSIGGGSAPIVRIKRDARVRIAFTIIDPYGVQFEDPEPEAYDQPIDMAAVEQEAQAQALEFVGASGEDLTTFDWEAWRVRAMVDTTNRWVQIAEWGFPRVNPDSTQQEEPAKPASIRRPGDHAAVYAEQTGCSYAEALIACNMD